MLGRTEDALTGRPATDFMPEEGRQHTQASAERRRAGKSERYELAWTNRDGQQLMTLMSERPIFEDQRQFRGSVCVVTDLTELKQAERELVQYRGHLEELVASRTEQLETANRELETFSCSVSHDLRVPLRAVDGYSKMLLQDYADNLDDEGKRLLQVVRDSTVKLGRLIDDILAFSRAGRTKMSSELVEMEALVREILAHSLAPALAGRDLAIEVGATSGNDETIYYVRDRGIGFDMQYADKLFGVFQRQHGAEVPGTGIGLAIIKRLVGRHGGRVWAEGKVGEGATFWFTLPKQENANGGQ